MELGGHPRPEPRSAGKAIGGTCRGPPDRLRFVRGRHSQGQLRRRFGDRLGRGRLGAARRSGCHDEEGAYRIRVDGQQARRDLASGQVASALWRKARQLAADQIGRRARRPQARHSGGCAAIGEVGPHRGRGRRRSRRAPLAIEPQGKERCGRETENCNGQGQKSAQAEPGRGQVAALHSAMSGAARKAAARGRRMAARGEVRRLSHRGACRRRRGQALHPHRPRLDASLRQPRRCGALRPRREVGGDRRRDRRARQGWCLHLLRAAARAFRRQRRADDLLCLRSSLARWRGHQARTVDRPQGEASRPPARPRRGRTAAAQRAFCRARQGAAGACLPYGPRGRRLETGRRALSQRPWPRLGEVEMHAAPGVRDRRLPAFASRGPRHPLAGAGLSQGRQATAGRSCRHGLFRSRDGRSHAEASCVEGEIRALFRRGRQGERRRVGEAGARRRNRVPFLDERRQYTSGFLPGPAGGQAGRGDRSGEA